MRNAKNLEIDFIKKNKMPTKNGMAALPRMKFPVISFIKGGFTGLSIGIEAESIVKTLTRRSEGIWKIMHRSERANAGLLMKNVEAIRLA